MTHIEKMKQWLEALEYIDDGANNQGAHTGISWRCVSNKAQSAIASLRQAIAEAEKQEPVIDKSAAIRIATALGWEPKRTWVGLTDEDLEPLCNDWQIVFNNWAYEFVKAIEAKLKQKNQ